MISFKMMSLQRRFNRAIGQLSIVLSSASDPETGVSSKDIIVSENPPLSVIIYLPKQALDQQHHNKPTPVVISIVYRLAPEHLLLIVYDDCWTAFQAVVSHYNGDSNRDSDSAGANLAHHILIKAGSEAYTLVLKSKEHFSHTLTSGVHSRSDPRLLMLQKGRTWQYTPFGSGCIWRRLGVSITR
ncbi:hypothetical protein V6N13_060601 [Hibiscus sabdariffa]